MKRTLICSIVSVSMLAGLAACAKGSSHSSSETNARESYQLNDNGCDTGKHEFTGEDHGKVHQDYCNALQDQDINNFCATSMREKRFEAQCTGDWNPKTNTASTSSNSGGSSTPPTSTQPSNSGDSSRGLPPIPSIPSVPSIPSRSIPVTISAPSTPYIPSTRSILDALPEEELVKLGALVIERYELNVNGCSTGLREFKGNDAALVHERYCSALGDNELNHGCALDARKQLYEDNCAGN